METSTAPVTASVRTPEAETEATTRIQPSKPLYFTNGVLKRHHPLHHHLNGPPVVVIYKECLKNHAASMGGHAVDGCCEFMPSPTTNPADPTSLKCAACGCHRNFHRREPEEPLPPPQLAIEYHPHHRHHPPQPPPPPQPLGGHSSPNSASPPPISSSFPSAPHMLLALSGGLSGSPPENPSPMTAPGGTPASFAAAAAGSNSNGRKRFRTKFTHIQKEKMYELAERIGWKMQKRDDGLIAEICGEVGVEKGVFKVWMHNNKSTLGKRHLNNHHYNSNGIGGGNSLNDSTTPSTHSHHNDIDNDNDNDNDGSHHIHRHHSSNDISVSANGVATNGSSSTS